MNTIENIVARSGSWLQVLLITFAAVLVYGHTLDVPFYLDDYSSILENPVIIDRENLSELWHYAPLRIVGYLSFAANFSMNHSQPAGYHIVNILIHILAGLSLFVLIRGLLKTPAMIKSVSPGVETFLPLFAALLFVVHPMQTQAVTYVVQRLASLAALFYIASLACYIYGRLGQSAMQRSVLFAAGFLFAVLAFFTKQNTLSLPLLMVAAELVFFPASSKRALRNLLAVGAGGLLLWGILAFVVGYEPLSVASLDALTKETRDISRGEYFLTQVNVLWSYIRMFFFPVGLHLEHEVALAKGLPVTAFAAHLLVVAGAVLACRRYPLLSFGIFFYYISSLVESSFVPIRDLMFEHRAYLPNGGLCLFSGWLLLAIPVHQSSGKRAVGWLAVAILLIFGVLTWQRNAVWRDPVALWRDSAVHAPNVARPWNEYAKHLIESGRHKEAIAVFQQTMARSVGGGSSPGTFLEETAAVNFMMVLAKEGETELALQVADDFLQRKTKPLNRSKMLTNRGNLFFQNKEFTKAEESYKEAIKVFAGNLEPRHNMGILFMQQGRLDEAEALFNEALAIDPKFQAGRAMLEKIKRMKR